MRASQGTDFGTVRGQVGVCRWLSLLPHFMMEHTRGACASCAAPRHWQSLVLHSDSWEHVHSVYQHTSAAHSSRSGRSQRGMHHVIQEAPGRTLHMRHACAVPLVVQGELSSTHAPGGQAGSALGGFLHPQGCQLLLQPLQPLLLCPLQRGCHEGGLQQGLIQQELLLGYTDSSNAPLDASSLLCRLASVMSAAVLGRGPWPSTSLWLHVGLSRSMYAGTHISVGSRTADPTCGSQPKPLGGCNSFEHVCSVIGYSPGHL